MEIGLCTFLTDYGLDPVALGRAVEERGFGSLFLTEHTHIPVSRRTPWPGGDVLPPQYSHTHDPFVALAAVAAVTDRITLGTAVSLVNQHHPITLAKQVAGVDRISGGRFELGAGAGWNVEEMENHGVDPRFRTTAMLERIDACRAIWTQDEAEYHGRFVDFGPIWCWPKPVRVPPVLIGGDGPRVLDRVLSHADGWMTLRAHADTGPLAARIAELHERARAAGRGPVPVTLFGAAPESLEAYAGAGVTRALLSLPATDPDTQLTRLDELAALIR